MPDFLPAPPLVKPFLSISSNQRRDTLSAFNALKKHAGICLAATPATAVTVRPILAGLNANTLDISPKRLANIRSLVAQSVARFGMRRRWITKDIALAPDWQALMESAPKREYRWSLSRLACYCSVSGIAPADVCPQVLLGLHAALEADCRVTKPRGILKQTISIWNMCRKASPDWPQRKLSSPFKKDPFMFKLEDFPVSFQQDVDAWIERMRNPDPLDPDRATPELIDAYARHEIARVAPVTVASALIGLKCVLIKMSPGLDWRWLQDITNRLKVWAKPAPARRDRVLPARAMMETVAHTHRRLLSGGSETPTADLAFRDAILVGILICCPIRRKNLSCLRIGEHLQKVGDEWHLSFRSPETKNHQDLTFVLPPFLEPAIDHYLSEVRPRFPGADGSAALFMSLKGNPLAYESIYSRVMIVTKRLFGVGINPHGFRTIAATFLSERSARDALFARPLLGHRSPATTEKYYIRASKLEASRRVSDAIIELRDAKST